MVVHLIKYKTKECTIRPSVLQTETGKTTINGDDETEVRNNDVVGLVVHNNANVGTPLMDINTNDSTSNIRATTTFTNLPICSATVNNTNQLVNKSYVDTTFVSNTDITNTGSGQVITTTERNKLNEITNTGSGQVITTTERNKLNEITNTGSGQVITTTERNKLNEITNTDQVRSLLQRKEIN